MLVGGFVATLLPPARGGAQAPDTAAAAEVLVTVGEERISRADLDRLLERQGASSLPEGPARTQATRLGLEKLVEERLVRGEIERQKITATESEVDRLIAQLTAQGKLREPKADAALRRQAEFDICIQKLLLPQFDEQALALTFEKHRREVDGTRVRLSHLVLRPDLGRGDAALPDTVRRAEEIRRQIVDGGMTFAEAAARFSAGPSRHDGGDLGFASRTGPHHEAVAAAAFALAEGDVSPPVVSPFGVHLLTVTAIEPGAGDARALRPRLQQIWARQAFADLIARLRRTTPVTYAAGVPAPATGAPAEPPPPPRPPGPE